MNWHTILDLVSQGNTSTTHFLTYIDNEDDLGPVLVAFANAQGGRVIVGIDRHICHLVGCELSESFVEQLVQKHCSPYLAFDCQFLSKNDKKVMILKVKKNNIKPYLYKQRCYVLDNAQLRLATDDEQMDLQAEAIQRNPVPQSLESLEEKSVSQELLHFDEAPAEMPNQTTKAKSSPSFNHRQQEAFQHVLSNGTISNREYRLLHGVSHKTAHLELVDLVEKQRLVSVGMGRSTHYRVHPEFR